jgi:hypothetical protein
MEKTQSLVEKALSGLGLYYAEQGGDLVLPQAGLHLGQAELDSEEKNLDIKIKIDQRTIQMSAPLLADPDQDTLSEAVWLDWQRLEEATHISSLTDSEGRPQLQLLMRLPVPDSIRARTLRDLLDEGLRQFLVSYHKFRSGQWTTALPGSGDRPRSEAKSEE